MEKLKLTDLDKFVLLRRANHIIWSRMSSSNDDFCDSVHHCFISPLDCHDVQFRCGVFSKKSGARVEVIYKCRKSRVILLWHYLPKNFQGLFCEDYVFIPKAITIEREFKGSLLISVVPDPENNGYYTYQSPKSIFELCEEDSEEGDAVDVHAGACLAEVDDDSTYSKNENVTL